MGILKNLRNYYRRIKEPQKFVVSEDILKTLDPSIVPLIKLCNENGIQTHACCSGDIREHDEMYHDYVSISGYVAFQNSEMGRILIANFLDSEYIETFISSAPIEPYEYFGQSIEKEVFAFYFKNEHGENMQRVYDDVKSIIERKKASPENLKIVNSIINKMRALETNFRFGISFNAKNLHSNLERKENYIDIQEMYLFEDENNVGNVKALTIDISKILEVKEDAFISDRIYLPQSVGKNVTPILDLINKKALSDRNRYTISRAEVRKPYDEVYYEEEYEYLGYDEEPEPKELDDLEDIPYEELEEVCTSFNTVKKEGTPGEDDMLI